MGATPAANGDIMGILPGVYICVYIWVCIGISLERIVIVGISWE